MAKSKRKPKRKSKKSSGQIWQLLTTLTLAATVLVSIYYLAIYISPAMSPLGPRATPTLAVALATPTPRPTIYVTDTPVPTWTPAPSNTPWPTDTPKPPTPTKPPTVTPLLFTQTPTNSPTPTETPTPAPTRHPFPFKLSDEGVQYMRYFFSDSCSWLGIAGEVVDRRVQEQDSIEEEGEQDSAATPPGPVHIPGIAVVLNGGGFQNHVVMSGDRPDYAPSGWEHFLDSNIKEGDFTIQLWHQGQPVSEIVDVHTFNDCRRNLAYLVFEIAWDDYVVPR